MCVDASRSKRAGLTVVSFIIAIAAASLPLQAQGPVTADMSRQFSEAFQRQPRVDVGIPADGARVVVLKFNDYLCPGCRQAELAYRPVLDKFAKSHPGAVKYVVKDWPWNQSCNFNAIRTLPGHEASCDAAVVARLARDRGKFDVIADWLYSNPAVTVADVRDVARRLLGVIEFDKEAAPKRLEIQGDIADGGVLGITSTPTYFVNGIKLPSGALPAELFELAITLELNRAAP
jgi:protein-disulfide isomerase